MAASYASYWVCPYCRPRYARALPVADERTQRRTPVVAMRDNRGMGSFQDAVDRERQRWLTKSQVKTVSRGLSEDHAVARVEQMLEAFAPRTPATGPHVAAHALWICPCDLNRDAPTWLIYDDGEGVAWCRVPDEVSEDDIVNAQRIGGGHTSPQAFLLWLQGKSTQPWPDDDYVGDPVVLEELGRKIGRT
jgi:hypothetical protein